MNKENLKKAWQRIVDAAREWLNSIKNAVNILLERVKLSDPKFRHNLTMAKSSKKKRTKKKYFKKCFWKVI